MGAHSIRDWRRERDFRKWACSAGNMVVPDKPLAKGDLNKAGIIILVKDRMQPGAPGLKDAIRSGLVVSPERLMQDEG